MSAVPSSLPASGSPSDTDPQETQEWLDALEAVLDREGPERAHFLLESLVEKARRSGAYIPFSANTAYINTIPVQLEDRSPGNAEFEERIRSYIRWNAMAMVVRANRHNPPDGGDLGGHIASFASLAVERTPSGPSASVLQMYAEMAPAMAPAMAPEMVLS